MQVSANESAAAASNRSNERGSPTGGCPPEPNPYTVSPSNIECTGAIALAMPWWTSAVILAA